MSWVRLVPGSDTFVHVIASHGTGDVASVQQDDTTFVVLHDPPSSEIFSDCRTVRDGVVEATAIVTLARRHSVALWNTAQSTTLNSFT